MNVLIAVIIILTMHFVADFPMQGEFLGKYKSKSLYLLGVHCFIYSGIVFMAFYYLFSQDLFIFIILFVSHFFADHGKGKILDMFPDMPLSKQKNILYIDQSYHLFILFCLFLLYI